MKNIHSKLTLVGLLAGAMLTSTAYSGNGPGATATTTGSTTGSTTGDTLVTACLGCTQIPQPNPQCANYDYTTTVCGTEAWMHNGNEDCKRFYMVTIYCMSGGTQKYTTWDWKGPGSWCTAGPDTSCQTAP